MSILLEGRKFDRPFYGITTEPIDKPTQAQILLVRELSKLDHLNLLGWREVLRKGGLQSFGPLMEDQAKEVSERLDSVGIPHEVVHFHYPRILPG